MLQKDLLKKDTHKAMYEVTARCRKPCLSQRCTCAQNLRPEPRMGESPRTALGSPQSRVCQPGLPWGRGLSSRGRPGS